MFQLPRIIQGGMGVGVSNWRLARAVSRLKQLGVVSGTALDTLLIRRLGDGDKDGAMRRGLDAFPFPAMAQRIWNEFFIPGGKSADKPFRLLPMHQQQMPRKLAELCIVSNFIEVFLAREGHDNPVGINYLEKLQLPHLASIYGAMLAGVSYVLMGAGIPLHAPAVLDAYAAQRPAEYRLTVTGATPELETKMHFNPADYIDGPLPQLTRPKFLAIVSSNTLASTMLRRASGKVDGFVVESPTAGGHNAPPRGKVQWNEAGEPIYGERDRVDLAGMRELGAPFWLAGGYGSAEGLREALEQGASGVQVGTAFSLSEESGLREDYKKTLMADAIAGRSTVFTDPLASPTGFPFKVAAVDGTYSDAHVYEARQRICDLGYLREAYQTPEGAIGFRCAAEPVRNYLAKGGSEEETVGRKCLCNGLVANIGLAQTRGEDWTEPAIVTEGDDLNSATQFLAPGATSYTAADVIHTLLGTRESA
ncbi:nitronate monooxygenase [Silvibacterium sp.]|uniref:nitronate monooxygenase n=1 Tax=Silvibacterium sp. TaxID=1964179 RepID=UPI0039E4B6B4